MIREGGSLDEGDPQEVAAAGPLAWTFGALTPSISFALIGVVGGEFLGHDSGGGLGDLVVPRSAPATPRT